MANPGDTVRITTKEHTYEGVLMPRPAALEPGVVVIKLDNGYNIGIKEDSITKTEIMQEYKPPKKQKIEVKQNPKLPTVAVLSFGGTISSKIDYTTGGVAADYTADDLLEMCPELHDVAQIKTKKIMQIMSEDVDFETLSQMAKELQPWLEDTSINGIVMTIGTDMLHYISAGLTFMLQGLSKPLIITASQRSVDRGSSDAFMNLSCAVAAAAKWDGKEVVVCMHGSSDDTHCILIRGNKVRKMHTSRRDAFRPINILPFAKIHYPSLKIETIYSEYNKLAGTLLCKETLSEKVGLVYVYPGMKPSQVEYFVKEKYEGLVVAGTALGHVPTAGASNLLSVLKKALDSGMIVVIATQTLYGRTHPFVYTNLRKLSLQLGCVFAEDLLPETAYMKLAWVLGNYSKEDAVAKFKENIAGEINPQIDAKSYLY